MAVATSHLPARAARAGPHAPRELVLRRGDLRARAGADLPARPGSTPASRTTSPSRAVPHVPRRRGAGRRRARTRPRAARVRQRLPAPRAPRGRGLRPSRDAPVPVPRVDVRPRRVAPHRAALGSRARLDRRRLSLHPVLVDTWGPLVFVNPDHERRTARGDARRPPGRARRRRARPVDARVPRSQPRAGDRANWKIVVENFLECYHCPVAHQSFSTADRRRSGRVPARHEPLVVEPVRARPNERYAGNGKALPYEPVGEIRSSQFHYVWPNWTLNALPGPANLRVIVFQPDGPDRTASFVDGFWAPGTSESVIEEITAFGNVVGAEDVALVESVHAGCARARSRRADCSSAASTCSSTSSCSCTKRSRRLCRCGEPSGESAGARVGSRPCRTTLSTSS